MNSTFSIKFKLSAEARFKDAKSIALALYREYFEEVFLVDENDFQENLNELNKGPFPCGAITYGESEQKYITDTKYIVYAAGDGGLNTCTKEGWHGFWSNSVTIEYDRTTNKGILTIEREEE